MCRTLSQGTSHLAALTLSPPINNGAYALVSVIFLIVSVIIFINIYIRPASIITIIRAASVFIMLSLISAATGFRQPGYRHLVQPVPFRKIPWLAAAWGSTGHGDGGGCVGAVVAGGALVEG